MVKEIILNEIRTNINKITLDDMVNFIEQKHPEDKEKFAKLVFNKANKVYNHFRARNVFLGLYFPDMVEKHETVSASEKIKSWLPKEENFLKKEI